MIERFPTLYERARVRPRVHRVFAAGGMLLALGLLGALIAVGDGDLGHRFARALGKGIVLIGFAGGYFVWSLTLRATKDPVWKALAEGRIRRAYPVHARNEPSVGVETDTGEALVVSCQTGEQQAGILAEFAAAGIGAEAAVG